MTLASYQTPTQLLSVLLPRLPGQCHPCPVELLSTSGTLFVTLPPEQSWNFKPVFLEGPNLIRKFCLNKQIVLPPLNLLIVCYIIRMLLEFTADLAKLNRLLRRCQGKQTNKPRSRSCQRSFPFCKDRLKTH